MDLQAVVDWLDRYEAALSAVAAIIVILGLLLSPLRSWLLGRAKSSEPAASPASSPPPREESPHRAVFVAPFEVAGDDQVLAVGLASELSNALSRTAGVEVVLAAEAADYVVSGTLLPHTDQMRVLARLSDRRGGRQLWAQDYELAREGFFHVQREITGAIVTEIGGELMSREFERMRFSTTESNDAWALTVHSANMVIQQRGGATTWDEAIGYAERAVAIDPDYAPAHGRLAALRSERISQFLSPDIAADVAATRAAADRASTLASFDPYVMMNCGQAWTLIGELTRGRDAIEQAHRAVPYDVLCWQFRWINIALSGDAEAIAAELPRVTAEIARYPNHPIGPFLWGVVGLMRVDTGDVPGAIEALRRCHDAAPGVGTYSAGLAALLHATGRTEEAAAIVRGMRERGFRLNRAYVDELAVAIPSSAIPALVAEIL